MSSSRCKISYPALVIIVQNLTYSKRMELSAVSLVIRKIHQRLPFSLNSLHYYQRYGKVDENGETEEVGSGVLCVESIKYKFCHDETTNQVKITCSLAPKLIKFSEEKSIIKKYFHYFLNSSTRTVKHVQIKESDQPFGNLADLKIPSISWTLNGSRYYPQFANFPLQHVFEKLELTNYNSILLTESHVKTCKHLILRRKAICAEYEDGNEESAINNFYCLLENKKLEVTLGLNYVNSFILLCDRLLLNVLHTGSSITAIFKTILPLNVWDTLVKHYEQSREDTLEGRRCLILASETHWVVAVFQNYFNEDTIKRESFTAIKMLKE